MRGAQFTTVAKRLANPFWLAAYARARRRARARESDLRTGSASAFSVEDFAAHLRSQEAAVLEVTGATPRDYAEAIEAAWRPQPEPGDTTAWISRTVLIEILAALVRLKRPRVVVEVGVERGYSSAVILASMSANGMGQLYSIDLPKLREDEREFVGRVVPQRFQDRWHLTLGPSRRELSGVLDRAGPLDLFLHDDHSYESQLEDLRRAWPCLSLGGVVVVDDVWTPALLDFGREAGGCPLLIRRWDVHDAVGLMRKPE